MGMLAEDGIFLLITIPVERVLRLLIRPYTQCFSLEIFQNQEQFHQEDEEAITKFLSPVDLGFSLINCLMLTWPVSGIISSSMQHSFSLGDIQIYFFPKMVSISIICLLF